MAEKKDDRVSMDPKKRVAIAERNENSGPAGRREAVIASRFVRISMRGRK